METLARITLEAPRPIFTKQEHLEMLFFLENLGATDLWVNARIALNRQGAPPALRDVWLDVVGPDGKPLGVNMARSVGLPLDSEYQVLAPGAKLRRALIFGRMFGISAPGTYRVTAHYQDGNPEPPAPPPGAVHLKDLLSSEPVSFQFGDSL